MQAVREGGAEMKSAEACGRRDQRSEKVLKNGSWQTGWDVLRYPGCRESGDEQNTGSGSEFGKAFESLKKLEKRTWQRAEDVVDWINCAERLAWESKAVEKVWKNLKKVLDKRIRVWYNLKAAAKAAAVMTESFAQGLLEKVEKLRKKFLTNAWSYDKINKFERSESWVMNELHCTL